MAAVVERSSWCKLLLVLFILVSLSFSSGFTSEDISNKITFIDISAVDGVVTAKLTVMTMDAGIVHDQSTLIEAFREAEKGNQEAAEQILEEAGMNNLSEYLGKIESERVPIPDAELNFYYTVKSYDDENNPVFSRVPIFGCAEPPDKETDEEGIVECDLTPYYEEIYEGKCTEVSVVFGDSIYGTQINDETYPYVEEIVYVCDRETTSLAVMRDEIKTILSAESQNPLCFASMLLGGMLLASMFFAGRSPLSLLDITTPLLPKAKSISYGGLRMGTGFGRMMKEMGDMGGPGGMIASSSKSTTATLLRYLRSKGRYSKRMIDLIMNSGANEVLKMLALRSLIAGKSERYVKGIIGLKGKALDEADFQKAYAKVLADLEKSSDADDLNKFTVKHGGKDQKQGLHDSVLLLAQMSMLNAMQQKAFIDSTGEIPAWFKTPLGKSLGRLPFIGTHIMGGTASLFFGGRHIGRYYNNFARGAVRGIGDVLTPKDKKFSKRIQMAVDDARVKGKKPGFFANWVALKDKERNLVKIFDNFEYGSALYQRMMKEARKDILNWLVGTIIAKYGGKMDLTREEVMEIGHKTPEELMFRGFNKTEFAKIEKELRKILSDSKMNDLTKAGKLMGLMDNHGIRFDRTGVNSAISMLVRIDTEDPKSPAAVGIIDPTNRYAMDCHKLIRLQSYLQQQFDVDKLTDIKSEYKAFQPGGKFFFTVGRETLSHGASDFTFGTFFRSKYRESLEKSKTGEKNPTSIGDIANYSFLRIVNERWGLIDPDKPDLDASLKVVMLNARDWLRSLANPGAFKDVNKASMGDLLAALYSPSGRAGVKEDVMDIMQHGAEYGTVQGAWRMDMKAHWRIYGGPMGGVKSSVENQAFGEVNRAHNVPMAIQTLLDKDKNLKFKDASGKYMNTIVESYLYKRLKGIIEQDNPNTYFTSQGEFDRFRQLWASYKSHIGEEKGIDQRMVTDKQIAEFIKKPLGVEELSKSSWIRLKEGSFAPFIQEHTFKLAQADRVINAKYYIRRGGYWEEFAPEKFQKQQPIREILLGKDSEIRKILGDTDYRLGGEIRGVPNAVVQEYVGLMDKLSKNMGTQAETESMFKKLKSLAASEPKKAEAYAAMAGRILQEHSKILGPLGFDLSKNGLVNLFGTRLGEKVGIEIMLNNYNGASTTEQKRATAKNLMDWAKAGGPGEERHVKVALILYNHADRTGDWKDFNSFDSVKLMPGATAKFTIDKTLKYEQLTGLKGWFKNVINTTRHITDPISQKFNLGLEQFMLSTFSKQMKSEYEGSLVSEYFRETGGKFAAKLAAGEFGSPDMRTNADPRIKEYNRLMDSFTRYHAVWDETITRDPRGNSSAIGGAFIYSGFFHHGPAMGFGPGMYRRWTAAGHQQPWTTWSGFKANIRERAWGIQFMPQMFNWAVGTPFGVAYRTYITSRWGFMSKYDRKYSDPPVVSETPKKYRAKEVQNYNAQLAVYQTKLDDTMTRLQQNLGYSKEDAFSQANQNLRNERPTPPSFELERNTLRPYSETQPRTSEGRAAMFNWFYASFDPTSTNISRLGAIMAAAPGLMTPFHLTRGVQSWILNKGTPGINRSDSNPYYVTPGGMRGQLIKATGPMVKRQYGGTELVTGVVRSPEDMWAYQAGVSAVWGNANPGASYVDFSQSMHLDPRAANYLRYESRFRPYMQYDEYVDRQSKLGLVKRDIDPFKLMMARNTELRHYKFPENTLFRFLNPAAYFTYKAQAFITKRGQALHNAREMYRDATTNVSTTRGGNMYTGASNLALKLGSKVGDVMHQRLELGFRKSIRYCQSCGGPMVEGGACNACSKKQRCNYCQQVVNPSHNHSCSHGIQRNLLNEDISGRSLRTVAGERATGWYKMRKKIWGIEP